MIVHMGRDNLKILQLLYDKGAHHHLQALDSEIVAEQVGVSWNELRYQIDRLCEEKYVVLKSRQIRARVFYTLYLTAKGMQIVEEIEHPPKQNLNYRNFDLQILPTAEGLRVEVLNSPAGEAVGETQLPSYSIDELISYVFDPNANSSRSVAGLNSMPTSVEAIGDEIGKILLPGDVRHRFEASMAMLANNSDDGLRIQLRIYDILLQKPPLLASIPWEIARIGGEYLSLRLKTPLVRYIPAQEPPGSLTVDGALRILVIISNPTDLQQLDVNAERDVLESALALLISSRQVTLTWLSDSRVQLLQDALRQPYHAIHFIGHGYYDESQSEGGLVFTNDNKESVLVSSEWLTTLVRDSTIRFVFLNSCESGRSAGGIAGELVRRGVAAALGFQSDVRDNVAVAFATGFYKALSDKWPVDAAVVEGRKAIANSSDDNLNSPDWVRPILYMRAPDGRLFR